MPKPSVPVTEIQHMLRQRWGEASDFHMLTEGLASQAFGFRSGAAEYVVRVNEAAETFQKDAFVARKFADSRLPVPKILDIGLLDAGPAFCVSRRAPGFRLHDLDAEGMARMARPVAQTMRAISASDLTDTSGFGRFDSTGSAPFVSWRGFLLAVASPDYFDWEAVSEEVNQRVVREAVGQVVELAAACPEERHLIHGDFGSYNVLTDGDYVTAVLDWNLALFGDPLYEVANLFFWNEERLTPFIRHLESEGCCLPQWRERMRCYQLRTCLQEINDSVAWGGPVDIGWLTTRCTQILGS